MALDRQDIERDFPIGRRGYDPDAVDRHLRGIADEFQALRAEIAGSASREREPLSAAATEQVRAIVEAAETSAASIRREAEDEAKKTRADAAAEARDHVARVSEATATLLQRVDAMEGELGALVESLRTGGNRLHADLALLQGNMGELRAAATGSGEAAVVEEAIEEEDEEEAAASEPEPEAVEEKEPTVEEAAVDANSDSEGARLVALNMALNGTSREETDRYLAENFELHDREALLDEVYARVG